jgi:uncharacterized delta-60 repeat protein
MVKGPGIESFSSFIRYRGSGIGGRIALGLSLVLFFAFPAFSEPSGFDRTFGTGGQLVTPIGTKAVVKAIAVQPDGKIVAVGQNAPPDEFTSTDFILARYETNGSLDTSFGMGGIVTTDVIGDFEFGADVLIQKSDGKIIVIGYVRPAVMTTSASWVVVRYNANGTKDTTFGINGTRIITIFFSPVSTAYAAAFQPDGKIVIVGTAQEENDTALVLARLQPNGAIDNSFGDLGRVVDLVNFHTEGFAVAVQPDGKILASGFACPDVDVNPKQAVVVRYTATGGRDITFGDTGVVSVPLGALSSAVKDLSVQPDGKIVGAGFATPSGGNGKTDFAAFRLLSNGAPDPGFGTGGKIVLQMGDLNDTVEGIALQPDGKIVLTGTSSSTQNPLGEMAIARLRPDGMPDTTFDTDGKLVIAAANAESNLTDLEIQPNGRIVGGGAFGDGKESGFSLIRLLGHKTTADYDSDGKTDISVYRPSEGIWYMLRSETGFTAVRFGLAGDRIVSEDYDGDGTADVAVFREGTWFILRSRDGFYATHFGSPGDIPRPADLDGDGLAELVVYRPSEGIWYSLNIITQEFTAIPFGLPADIPVTGDYDSDGKADRAVYRPSDGTWYLLQSRLGFAGVRFGAAGDIPVPSDLDGDQTADIAVFRPSEGNWYYLRSRDGAFVGLHWGLGTDIPVPADYDGDGISDIAVFRDGIWYILRSGSGFSAVSFGTAGDIPVR